jgi:hypothetical protein
VSTSVGARAAVSVPSTSAGHFIGITPIWLLAAAVHEWLDIGAGYGDYRRWVAVAAVPLWLWVAWKWPKDRVAAHARAPVGIEVLCGDLARAFGFERLGAWTG